MIARAALLSLVVVACGPTAGSGDGGGDVGSTSGVETSATPDDGVDTTPDDGVQTTTADGGDDSCTDCCPPLPDGDERCAAAGSPESCAAVDVGDDFCIWIDWYPVRIGDVPACSIIGDPRGECRRQTCQSEGCYSGDSCGGRFADIVVVAAGPTGRELGIGPWCIPEGELCHFVDGAPEVENLFECACACSPIVSCGGPLEPYVEAWMDSSSETPVECGSVTLDDSLDAWNLARQCAITNASGGTPFTAVFHRAGIETSPQEAFAAREAGGFEIVAYAAEEGPDAFTLSRRSCGALELVAECDFGVGDPCLECVDAGRAEPICPP